MTKDELIGEDVRLHRRTRRLARSAIGALSLLLIVSVAAGIVALAQRSSAVEQRNFATEQSLIAQSRLLAATAVDRSGTDLQSSLLLAATAYRTRPEPQTASALHRVLSTTPELAGFHDFGETLSMVAAKPGAQTVIGGTTSGKVIALDTETGSRSELFDLGHPVSYLAQSNDGNTVVASALTAESSADPSAEAVTKVWRSGEVENLPLAARAMSPSGQTIALIPHNSYNESGATIWRTNGAVKTISTKSAFIALPDEDTLVGVDGYGNVQRTSINDEQTQSTRISMGLHMFGGDLSKDGRRFSFIRGGEQIEVWDFADPLPEGYRETDTLVATTGSTLTRSIALDPNGSKLATAADGSIYVSEVVTQGERPQVTVLRGAGQNVKSLTFADTNTLISVSGQTVAIWRLDSRGSLATYVPATLYGDCNACAPATTTPSPNGRKAVVNPPGGYGTAINFDRRWSALFSEIRTSDARRVLESKPALTWLDDDRLFAYSATDGKAWVIEGDYLDQVTAEFTTHASASRVNKSYLRNDGAVVMVADGKTLEIDPVTGASKIGNTPVDLVSADGKYAVSMAAKNAPVETTHIEIVSTESGQQFYRGDIEGKIDPQFFVHDRDAFVFARPSGGTRPAIDRETDLLRLYPETAEVQLIGTLGPGVRYSPDAAADGFIYAEGSGEILQVSLDDASTISVLSILSAPVSPNGLGVSGNGHLVIESESTQQAVQLPVTPDSWTAKSCELANRQLEPRDYASLITSVESLQLACEDRPQ